MYSVTPLNAQICEDSVSAYTTTASADRRNVSADRRNVCPNGKLKISPADSGSRNTCEPMVKDTW